MFQIEVRLGRLQLTEFQRAIVSEDEVDPGVEQRRTYRLDDPFGERHCFTRCVFDSIMPAEPTLDAIVARSRQFPHGMRHAALDRDQREFPLCDATPEGLHHRITRREQHIEMFLGDMWIGISRPHPQQTVGPGRHGRFHDGLVPPPGGAERREVDRVALPQPSGRDDGHAALLELDEIRLMRVPAQHIRRVVHLDLQGGPLGPGQERLAIRGVVPWRPDHREVVGRPVHGRVVPHRTVEGDVRSLERCMQCGVDRAFRVTVPTELVGTEVQPVDERESHVDLQVPDPRGLRDRDGGVA